MMVTPVISGNHIGRSVGNGAADLRKCQPRHLGLCNSGLDPIIHSQIPSVVISSSRARGTGPLPPHQGVLCPCCVANSPKSSSQPAQQVLHWIPVSIRSCCFYTLPGTLSHNQYPTSELSCERFKERYVFPGLPLLRVMAVQGPPLDDSLIAFRCVV